MASRSYRRASDFLNYSPRLASDINILTYRSGTVNSKSFVGKVFHWIKWKYELTVHFKLEMIGKNFA